MFAFFIFTLYIIALVVTNKLDFNIDGVMDSLNKNSLGKSMQDYVASKNPQSTADVEHSIYEYMRRGNRSFQ